MLGEHIHGSDLVSSFSTTGTSMKMFTTRAKGPSRVGQPPALWLPAERSSVEGREGQWGCTGEQWGCTGEQWGCTERGTRAVLRNSGAIPRGGGGCNITCLSALCSSSPADGHDAPDPSKAQPRT